VAPAALREGIWIPEVWKALVRSKGQAPAVLYLPCGRQTLYSVEASGL
jgi:hypothetical protein